MAVTEQVKRLVSGECGNRCCYQFKDTGCGKPVMVQRDDPAGTGSWVHTAGDVAHIRGESQGSARYDAHYEAVNDPSNLMLMCAEHHDLIDRVAPEQYPVDVLER